MRTLTTSFCEVEEPLHWIVCHIHFVIEKSGPDLQCDTARVL